MTNRKLYYLKDTGEVILHIAPNDSIWAEQTTRAQDEVLYSPLQSYNPEMVDLLELEPEVHASDFTSSSGFRVNIDTLEVEFQFPVYYPPLTEQLKLEVAKSESLQAKSNELQNRVDALETENEELKLLLADMALNQGGAL